MEARNRREDSSDWAAPSTRRPRGRSRPGRVQAGPVRARPCRPWHAGLEGPPPPSPSPVPGGTPGVEAAPGAGAGGAGLRPGRLLPGPVPPAPGPVRPSAAAATEGPGFGGGLGASAEALPMIGDMSPLRTNAFRGSAIFPPLPPESVRRLPRDRVERPCPIPPCGASRSPRTCPPGPRIDSSYNFNYYNNVNATINAYDQVPINHMKAYRHLFGWEKTFNEGKGSIGLRLPLNTLTADRTARLLDTHQHGHGEPDDVRQVHPRAEPQDGQPGLGRASRSRRRPAPADSPALPTCSGSTPRPFSPSSATSTTSATCTSRASAHSISPPITAT